MIIGILQTGHAPQEIREAHGDYDAMFVRLFAGRGFTFRVFDVENMVFPDSIAEADGWIITGSKHGVYEDHPFIAPLEALIRQIHAAGAPLIGICFGHQIVAQALGGRVVKFPGGWSVGHQSYEVEGRALRLNAWHQDQVVDLPPGARVLGRSEFCANAVLAYGERVLTVQAHPEFDADVIAALIDHRGEGVVPEPLLDAARATLDRPVDIAPVVERMATILEKGRVHA